MTPQYLLPLSSKLSPLQDLVSPSWDLDDDTLDNDFISSDDLLRGVGDYTDVLDFTANTPANHEKVSGSSAVPQVQEVVDQIRDLTRINLLTPVASLRGAASPAEPLPGAVREPLSGGASPKTGGRSPARMPATARREAAMHDNRIHLPNVVTRGAAAELTGEVTRYRGERPNNNNNDNNNHAALPERFQPSTLHKLRKLDLCINTDSPGPAHQLDAGVVAAEVAYTRTNS